MSSTLTHTLLILVHIKLIILCLQFFYRFTVYKTDIAHLHQISLPMASASSMSEYTVQLMKNKLTHPWGGFTISTTVQ